MPFDGDNQDEVFNKIKAGKFNTNVDLSEECKDLLKKMNLEKVYLYAIFLVALISSQGWFYQRKL